MKILKYSYVLMIFLISCAGKKESINYSISNVLIKADGPLFEGSNTAQCEYQVEMEAFLKTQGKNLDQLAGMKLMKADFSMADSSSFDLIKSISLQIASDQAEMKELGGINPIPSGQSLLSINLSQNQGDLSLYFKQKQLSFVLDADLAKDTSMNLVMRADLDFQLTFK